MNRSAVCRVGRRATLLVGMAGLVLAAGTVGYRILSDGLTSWLDCLFMTVITVTTIGYGEVVDLSRNPDAIRIFSMALAVSGIGVITVTIGSITSFAVDGELKAILRRRRMNARIQTMNGHYILAGWSGISRPILAELTATRRPVVVMVPDAGADVPDDGEPGAVCRIEGDVTDDETLQLAGIDRAAGVFAATGDDHTNIIVCLSARRLNSTARIVSAVTDPSNAVKVRRAGANATVSVDSIGGLRMASEMIRPSVVTFLDIMLRSDQPTLRVEEVPVSDRADGRTVADLDLARFTASLLLALKRKDGWKFNPGRDHVVRRGDTLVFMTTPQDLDRLRIDLATARPSGEVETRSG